MRRPAERLKWSRVQRCVTNKETKNYRLEHWGDNFILFVLKGILIGAFCLKLIQHFIKQALKWGQYDDFIP